MLVLNVFNNNTLRSPLQKKNLFNLFFPKFIKYTKFLSTGVIRSDLPSELRQMESQRLGCL